MKDFKQLKVWEISHRLALAAYKTTTLFPKEEVYGLTSQIRRACVSIPSNMAEGCGRGGDSDFRRFLQIAFGSACELEYQLLLALDLKFMPLASYEHLQGDLDQTKRMLAALIRKLNAES